MLKHLNKWNNEKNTNKYDIKDLRRAVEAVGSKRNSFGKAATKYSVPKTRLFRVVRAETFKLLKKDRHYVIKKDQEDRLERHVNILPSAYELQMLRHLTE